MKATISIHEAADIFLAIDQIKDSKDRDLVIDEVADILSITPEERDTIGEINYDREGR